MKLPRPAVLAAACVLAACASEAPKGVITREQFIRANVALRSVADSTPQVDSARARALRKEKVTPQQLRAWLGAHQSNADVLTDTWAEIARRVDARDPRHHPIPPVTPRGMPGTPGAPGAPPPAAPLPTPVLPPPTPAPQPAPPMPPPSAPPAGYQTPVPAAPVITRPDSAAPRPDTAAAKPPAP